MCVCKTFPPVYNSAKIIKNPSRFSRVIITNVLPPFLWFTVYKHKRKLFYTHLSPVLSFTMPYYGTIESFKQLEGTHRVRNCCTLTQTLTLTLTFDLSTTNHFTSKISQGHFLYKIWTLWVHSFWVMLRQLVWTTHLLTLWPWPLTFQTQIHVTSSISQDHTLHWV